MRQPSPTHKETLMRYYLIDATIVKTYPDGSTSTIQIPTFLLDKNVLGIVSQEHAREFIPDIVNPTKDPSITISSYAVRSDF